MAQKKKPEKFNPIKEDRNGIKARGVVWSTEILEVALRGLEKGQRLVANPFYDNNTKLTKGDLVFHHTAHEEAEWLKCKNDIIYFAENYCKLMTPKGIRKVELREYQHRYLKHLIENNMSIMVSCRQAGKTTTSAIFMLHYVLFNFDKNALVMGNKRKTAVEILDKVKKIFYEVPYFLKPGVLKWNEAEIVFDNGCRVMADATTLDSGVSFTFHMALLDEFSKIPKNIQSPFYEHVLPTLTAADAQVIISSTVNGKELFYRLVMGAKLGENDYKLFEVTWQDVPNWNRKEQRWEKRDEAWHQRMIANYGSEEAFEKQFGISFDISSNALINKKILQRARTDATKFIIKDVAGVPHSNYWVWNPDFDIQDLKKHHLVIPIDIAEGLGGDYTVIPLFKLIPHIKQPAMELIGYFRSNVVPREECVMSLMKLLCKYSVPENYLISIEKNTYGDLFVRDIRAYTEEFPDENFDMGSVVKYYNDSGSSYSLGIKLTANNKTPHCLLFQEDFERGLIKCPDEYYIFELENFCDDGTKHYKASYGHDDAVMTMVQIEFVKKTLQYKLFVEDYEDSLDKQLDENVYNPYERVRFDDPDYEEIHSGGTLYDFDEIRTSLRADENTILGPFGI